MRARGGRDEAFISFVAARRRPLLRIAFLLTGSWTEAEDLVQTTLTKLYGTWHRVGHDRPEAYARQVMLRAHLDERRRGWHRREWPTDELPDWPAPAAALAETGAPVRAALAQLTPRQRATIVLRFWLDMSVEQTAQELQCSTGTVKSQTARAIVVLRKTLSLLDSDDPRTDDVENPVAAPTPP